MIVFGLLLDCRSVFTPPCGVVAGVKPQYRGMGVLWTEWMPNGWGAPGRSSPGLCGDMFLRRGVDWEGFEGGRDRLERPQDDHPAHDPFEGG